MSNIPKLPQPGDKTYKIYTSGVGQGGKGKTALVMQLQWHPRFASRQSHAFWRSQVYVDQACIRYMDKFTPMRTGALKRSPTLGTKIGSGRIEYASPYARYQYYGKLMVSSLTGSAYALQGEKKVLTSVDLTYDTSAHPLAGPYWFERMKAEYGDRIRKGAAVIAGGTSKK
ncbi:MAG: hypothetical protein IJ428_05820 [Clostridia bacterium]|nr:hypothetical protein [Clostridia bacterium]